MNQDLTTGKPGAVLRKFCLPLFGSIIFQQLYNIADSFVAGKFIDNKALAAVGNGYEITLIFIAFAFGCNIGCSVLVSQLFGARQHRDMKTAVHTTLIASGVLCAVLMLVGFLCTDSLLRLIQTPEEILEDSKLYLNIYILGLPFVFYYNVATGIFSALGDSRTPFIFLACSSLSNIGADILFVTAFGMKVDGVAWATFLCQGVSCVLAIIFVLRRFRRFETPEKAPVFSWRLLGRIATVAIPSILQQSFISVGNIVIQSVINGFGTATIAGYSASVKLNNLVITSLTTLGNGVSNFTAQNLGAGRQDRIRRGTGKSLLIGLAMYLILGGIGMLLTVRGAYQYLFMSADKITAATIRCGNLYLYVDLSMYFALMVLFVFRSGVQGVGHAEFKLVAGCAELAARVLICAFLQKLVNGGAIDSSASVGAYIALCFADPGAWILAVVSLLYPAARYLLGGAHKKPSGND